MNFDNGQGVKFGVSNYGPGLANAANVCHFQYMGMGEAQGTVKPGVPQMQVERNAFVPPYHNVGLAHLQGNPTQAGFPMGVNMTMSSQMSFNSLPPMDSFGPHGQRFPPNQRINMNYKTFNNWVRPNQNNQTSLPSIGHLWSHFQQQQMQKHTVPPPPAQSQSHQQNFYPNQQQVPAFQNTVTLSPGGQRPHNVSYQFQAQNPVMNHVRMYQNVPQERMPNCLYGNSNNPGVCPNTSMASDLQSAKASVPSPSAAHHMNVPGPQVTAICNQVTNTTTTITMTNCSATSLTTAMSHASGMVPTVVTSMAGITCEAVAGETGQRPVVEDLPASAASCALHHTPRLSDRDVPEGTESCSRESEESLHIVKIPFGWRRTTESGAIVYYSPSNTRLTSYQEVCKYLSLDGTCKCGLECPLMVEKVFSFDSLVDGKLWTVEDMTTEDLTKLCIHKRKIIAMATFQNSRTMSVPKEPRTRKGKKGKSKVNSSYDGLLVSQILSHKGKVLPPMNHGVNKHNVAVPESASSPSSAASDAPKMFEGKPVHCKSQAMQQLQHLNKVNNVVGKLSSDPMDDLGPITCQVPAKLDFSKDEFVEDHKNLLQVSVASHPAGQAIFHPGSMSPQGPFGQEQMKHSAMMQQSPSPCASAASPSLVNSVPNTIYRPNVAQHFQCQLPMNLQQNPGNIMFQALMQVQNAPGQRFANPPVFEQHNVQGGHFQVGGQANIMIHQGYPQLSDMTWLDTGKPKIKRPRSKKDKQKLNSILDRTSPCPNVDARQISQEASKNPSSNANASFMDNPAAFLAQQTALVHSSLSSTNTDMSQQNLKTPQNPLHCVTTMESTNVSITAPDSKPMAESPNGISVTSVSSISELHTPTNSQSVISDVKSSASLKGDGNANCDSSDLPDNLSNSSQKEDSVHEQCCDDNVTRSKPTDSDDSDPLVNAKPNSVEAIICKDSLSSEETLSKPKHAPVSPHIHTPTSSRSTSVSTLPASVSPVVVTSTPVATVMPNNIVELLAANNMNLGVVHQGLSQGPGEFPASTLLSAAAQAQVSQQNPLGVLLGQPMQVSPSIQVSTGQETSTVNTLPDMMVKAGMNTIDQLNFQLQQQGNTLMLPQNSSLLAGPLPGGYINPAVQGLPLNMFLPINQTLANTTGISPAQNVLIGLDPKTPKAATQCRMSGVDPSKGLDGFSDPTVNFPTLFANVPTGSNAFGANMKLPTTSSNSHVSAAVNAPLLNSQFPYVSMNTPMPPMSLPLVTNVTNSLSQVIPAVGVPQTLLNQQSVAPMLSTVTMPTLNNSVMITNQMPSMHASQPGTQNVAFVGAHTGPVGESDASVSMCGTEEASSRVSMASNVIGNESVCLGDQVTKMDSPQQCVDASMNKVLTHPTEVLEPINNAGHVVLLPNPNVPLLQLYGGNNLLTAQGMDKYPMNSLQQFMLPGAMIDPQLCQGQAAVGGGLNLLQMQQMWNNAASGNMTNLNALQLQQLQTLQLQLLLQQIQGMQSLVNQIQLQGAVQQPVAADAPVQQDLGVEAPGAEDKLEDRDTDGELDDDQHEDDKSEPADDSLESGVEAKPDILVDESNKHSQHCKARSKREMSGRGSDAASVKCTERVMDQYSCRNKGTEKIANSMSVLHNRIVNRSSLSPCSDVDEQKDKASESGNVQPSTTDMSFAKARHAKSAFKNLTNDHFGQASSDAECSVTSTGELVKCNGPDDDIGDDTDSIDDDMSLDDLRRGLKRPKTDDDTDMDSASMDNYDEDSLDGLSDGCVHNFSTGDVVWGQIRGFPLWPGKLVPDSAADGIQLNPSLEDRPDAVSVYSGLQGATLHAYYDTVLVMWYGDHTFTRVEPHRLKTWEEGKVAHHKTRRKYRRGRKMNSHLEAAIQAAVKDLVSLDPSPPAKSAVKSRSVKKKKA